MVQSTDVGAMADGGATDLNEQDASEVVRAKMLFSMPDGDAGLVRRRQNARVTPDKTSYGPGDVAVFVLASSGRAIDPTRSYFVFRLKCTLGTTLNEVVYMPIGVQGLIKQVKTTNWGGVAIEDLLDYNIWAGFRDRLTVTPEDVDSFLLQEGWCPNLFPITRANQFPSVAGNAIGTVHGSGVTYGQAALTGIRMPGHHDALAGMMTGLSSLQGKYYTYRLRHSGLWGKDRVIPLKQFGQLRIEITFDSIEEAFSIFKLPEHAVGNFATERVEAGKANIAAADIAGTSEAQIEAGLDTLGVIVNDVFSQAGSLATIQHAPEGSGSNIPWQGASSGAGQNSTYGITAAVTNYQIDKLSFVVELVDLSASMDQALDQAVLNGGLPFHFTTYSVTKFSLASTTAAPKTGAESYQLNKAAANMIAVNTIQISDAAKDKYKGGRKFRFWQGGMSAWQYRLGVDYWPIYSITNNAESLRETLKSLPCQGDSVPRIPPYKYSWDNNEMANAFHNVAASPGTPNVNTFAEAYASAALGKVQPWISPSQGLLNSEYEPDLYCIGIRLQTLPGVVMTGASTNSGNQLSLDVSWDLYANEDSTYPTLGRQNSRFDQNRIMVNFLTYTRIVVLGPSQNIIIKE